MYSNEKSINIVIGKHLPDTHPTLNLWSQGDNFSPLLFNFA